MENSDKKKENCDVKSAIWVIIILSLIGFFFLGGICQLDWYLDKKHGTKRYSKEKKIERRWENPWDDSRWQENEVPWLEHTQQ